MSEIEDEYDAEVERVGTWLKSGYDENACWFETTLRKVAPGIEWEVKRWKEEITPFTYRLVARIDVRRNQWTFEMDVGAIYVAGHDERHVQLVTNRIVTKLVQHIVGFEEEK